LGYGTVPGGNMAFDDGSNKTHHPLSFIKDKGYRPALVFAEKAKIKELVE